MNQESSSESTSTNLSLDSFTNLKLDDEEKVREIYELKHEEREIDDEEEDEEEEDEEEEEAFSFSVGFDGVNPSQITAEDVFFNGQIKPVFPFFNQDLLLQEGVNMEDLIDNNRLPNVKKVFIEAGNETDGGFPTSGNDNIAGPYCEWDKKVVDGCKKSNSTGFSKLWRFKEFMHRSSSDGRDAFVFLNNTTPSGKGEEKAGGRKGEKKTKEVPERKVNGEERKVKAAGVNKAKVKGKKVVNKSKKALSSHEVYMRSKAKEGDRRRTYLPYRPEVVGFFTNVTGGGLTRNVHPF